MAEEIELSNREFEELRRRTEFVELVRHGASQVTAAHAVGWSPQHLRVIQRDPDWTILLSELEDHKDATIEDVLYQAALEKRDWAVKLWLFNRQRNSWKDVSVIRIEGEVRLAPETIEATKAVIKEQVLAALTSSGIGAWRGEILDAEVIGEIDGPSDNA